MYTIPIAVRWTVINSQVDFKHGEKLCQAMR
jgi:hypothetical protein